MNEPRLLSRNGVDVRMKLDADDDADVDIVNNEEEQQRTISISDSKSKLSIPIKKFAWEDTLESTRIRIESVPKSKSINAEHISWSNANISKSNITITKKEKNMVFVELFNPALDQYYHLHLKQLF